MTPAEFPRGIPAGEAAGPPGASVMRQPPGWRHGPGGVPGPSEGSSTHGHGRHSANVPMMAAIFPTASVMPVSTALEMMLWPMEYSLTPATLAKAHTLS